MTHNTKFDSMNDLSNEHCISGNSILKTKKSSINCVSVFSLLERINSYFHSLET